MQRLGSSRAPAVAVIASPRLAVPQPARVLIAGATELPEAPVVKLAEAPVVTAPFQAAPEFQSHRQTAEELQALLEKSQERAAASELTLGSLQEEIRELRQQCQLGREETEKLGNAVEQSIPSSDHFEILRSMSKDHLTAAYLWEQKERDADATGRALFEQAAEQLKASLAKREEHLKDYATVGTELQRASASHKASEARIAKLEDQLRQLASVHQLVGDCQKQVEDAQRHALGCWRQLQRKLAEADDLRTKCAALKTQWQELTGKAPEANPAEEMGAQESRVSENTARALVLAHLDALEGKLLRGQPEVASRELSAEEEVTISQLPLPASVKVSMPNPAAINSAAVVQQASPLSTPISIISRSGTATGATGALAREALAPSQAVCEASDKAVLAVTGTTSTLATTPAASSPAISSLMSPLQATIAVPSLGATGAVSPPGTAGTVTSLGAPGGMFTLGAFAATPMPQAHGAIGAGIPSLSTMSGFTVSAASLPGVGNKSPYGSTRTLSPKPFPRSPSAQSSPGLVSALQTAAKTTQPEPRPPSTASSAAAEPGKPVVEVMTPRHCTC